jgi:hypothetical protein
MQPHKGHRTKNLCHSAKKTLHYVARPDEFQGKQKNTILNFLELKAFIKIEDSKEMLLKQSLIIKLKHCLRFKMIPLIRLNVFCNVMNKIDKLRLRTNLP